MILLGLLDMNENTRDYLISLILFGLFSILMIVGAIMYKVLMTHPYYIYLMEQNRIA